jgi:hypothetical protein
LEGLNDGERQAVMLRYLRRDSYEQLAALLGISPAAARQRVHRGLERMREFLKQHGVLVPGIGVLAEGMRQSALQPVPPDLIANTLEAAAKLSTNLGGTGGLLVAASIKAKLVAVVVIVSALGVAAGTAAYIHHHRRVSQTVYFDPATGHVSAPGAAPAAGAPPSTDAGIRPAFQLIRAASYDAAQGTKTVGGFVGYINKGDWLRYNKVDLGPPGTGQATFLARVSCPDKYAGNTIEVRKDAPDGPLLAVLKVQGTGGYGNWRSQSVPTTNYTGGVHDLYVQFSGGGWNFDTFNFALNSRPALAAINAVSFNEAKGVQTRGGVICETSDGDWTRYDALDFAPPGANAVAITYSCDNARAGGTISLRLDDLGTAPIAEVPVIGTGGFHRYTTRTIPLDAITGSHNVILSFSGKSPGIANVSRIQFLRQTQNAPPAPATTASSAGK